MDSELKLAASFDCPVLITDDVSDVQEGDIVEIESFDKTDHWLHNNNGPTLGISRASALGGEIGVLSKYYAAQLYPWLHSIYQISIQATVKQIYYESGEKNLILRVKLHAPEELHSLYKPRMLWALKPKDGRDESNKQHNPLAQEPPSPLQLNFHLNLLKYDVDGEFYLDEPRGNKEAIELYSHGNSMELQPYSEPLPRELRTPLLPHQLQGVQWALDIERPAPSKAPSYQFWTKIPGGYRNKYDPYGGIRSSPPHHPGGLLADDMGLGKTLTMLAVIMITKQNRGQGPTDYNGKTLVVASRAIWTTWEAEIQLHCPALVCRTYEGKSDHKTNYDNADIVLCTYQSFIQDRKNPLADKSWERVILDEGHVIRTTNSQTHKAICQLRAKVRYVLSATPIINHLRDLGALVKFLQTCHPFDNPESWESYVGTGTQQRDSAQDATQRITIVKELLGHICLRRTKYEMQRAGKLALPKVTYQTLNVKLTEDQQRRYNELRSDEVGKLIMKDSSQKPMNVLTLLLRLRQIVLHPNLAPPSSASAVKDGMCTSCGSCLEEGSKYCAKGHTFCVMCQNALGPGSVCHCGEKTKNLVIPVEDEDWDEAEEIEHQPAALPSDLNGLPGISAKIDALVALLKSLPSDDKALIFSSFVGLLDFISLRLDYEGISFLPFHGKIPKGERMANLEQFKMPGKPVRDAKMVLLASYQVGGFGLNLTIANHVFLMDPWWQSSTELQAIDRVNRIGQKKPVSVVRLVARGTIEDRVLAIQAQKAELISQALSNPKPELAIMAALSEQTEQRKRQKTFWKEVLELSA